MKKILVVFILLINIFPVNCYGLEVNQNSTEYIITLDSGMQTLGTFYGDGGVARLNYMQSAKSFSWNIKTSIGEVIAFNGMIEIKTQKTNVSKGKIYLNKTGSNIGGVVSARGFNLSSSYTYRAYITGTSVALSGNKYKVNPNSYISFAY